jgi:hypothetical protein
VNLPFGDEFQPGPMKMVGFDAPFRCWGVWDQDLEDALGNPHHALILAHPDAELDDVPVGVPPGIWRKAEEHESLSLIGARR